MKTYLRIWARPLGAEPKLFFSKETAEVPCSCDPEIQAEVGCWPWCQPDVREFESEFQARLYMKEYYPTCYEELKEGT